VLWWVIYVIVVYVNYWSWHVHGSHSVYLQNRVWQCTEQSGAPPDMNSTRSLSFFSEADRWNLGPLGTPDSPMRPCDRWRRPHVARWSRCRPLARALLAHRIVRWILATATSTIPESSKFVAEPAWAPDNPVHCMLVQVWLDLAKLLQSNLIWFNKVPST
jgi:hypothetical protein